MREERESTGSTPRWVKVFGVLSVYVVLLFLIMLVSGGRHGPGRHLSGGRSGHVPASSVTRTGAPKP